MTPLIKIDDLCYSITTSSGFEKPVVKNLYAAIDLSLNNGIVPVLAEPGTGKSVLCKLLSGILKPGSGSINISENGRILKQAYVSGMPSTISWLNVRENLALVAGGTGGRENSEIINECLMLAGLEGYEMHYPSPVSFGFHFRIAVARALVCKAEIIIVDDYFKNLNYTGAAELFSLMRLLAEQRHVFFLFALSDSGLLERQSLNYYKLSDAGKTKLELNSVTSPS